MILARFEKILFFLTVLFLPTQLGKHFWPPFSYIYSLRVDYLSPTLYFWDLLTVALFMVWFFQKPKINRFALNLFLFFILTQAFSLVGASNVLAGAVRLEQYTLAGFLGVYLASMDFKNLSGKIFLPLVLSIVGESLIAVLQFIYGQTLGLWFLGERTFALTTPGIAKFDFYGNQFLRPYATFPHPNVLAAFVLIGVSILYQLLQKQRFVVLALIFGGITVFISMSRTAILTGAVAILPFIKKKWWVWIALGLLIISPVLFTRFWSLFNFDNLAFIRREELIGSAWLTFLRHPLTGVGLNNFIPAMADNLTAGPNRFLQPVHNIFLLALSETGLIGFLGFIVLIALPIFELLKLYAKRYTLYPILIIVFLGLFDHFLTLPQGYRLLFLVWGLSLSFAKDK